ncbi:MAG: hypothetical protein BWZ07_00552 [Alphaproteobacteria bacterium ADurb.BinA280]|jgi:hypothetical protein|nr:hypothetical protein [Xanthomonadales bacterium]MCC6504275.1 hypothetical protein [Aquimonas sp.]OPZ13428.1 MAG: hypothetical protein BWZ07_00552 [Alphaproteobacteria bacterium ADurb.BinA280]
MNMRILLLVLVGVLSSCASGPGPRERMATQYERYSRFAGDAVASFPFFTMQNWVLLGQYRLAVYTKVNEAWLLEVSPPCSDLEFAQAIALSSSVSRVSAKFDHVLVGRDRCPIKEIRPVDVRAMKRERKLEQGSE